MGGNVIKLPVAFGGGDFSVTNSMTQVIRILVTYVLLMASGAISTTVVGQSFDESRIREISMIEGLTSSKVHSIIKDKAGFMWFATSNGLCKYDGHSITSYLHQPNDPNSISHNKIMAMYQDGRGTLWIGTGNGLNRFDYETQSFTRIQKGTERERFQVLSITEDKRDMLWVATSNGVFIRDITSSRFVSYDEYFGISLPDDLVVSTLFCDASGDMWLGTWDRGIYRVNAETGEYRRIKHSNQAFTIGKVTTINQAQDGFIWIGTWGFGLARIHPKTEDYKIYEHDDQKINSLNNNRIKALEFDTYGYLWVGMEEGGLDRFAPEVESFSHYFSEFQSSDIYESPSVYSIYIDEDDLMWLGFRSNNIKIVPLEKSIFTSYSRQNEDYEVFAISEYRNGLWLGVKGGIDYLSFDKQTFKHVDLPNKETPVSLYMRNDNNLVIGTYKGSLFNYNIPDASFTKLISPQQEAQFEGFKINSFYSFSENILFIGTGIGFFKLNLQKQELTEILPTWIHSIYPISEDQLALFTFGDTFFHYSPTTGIVNTFPLNAGIQDIKSGVSIERKVYLGSDLGLFQYDLETDNLSNYYSEPSYVSNRIEHIVPDAHGNLWMSSGKHIIQLNLSTQSFKSFNDFDGLSTIQFRDYVGAHLTNGNIVFGGKGGVTIFNPAKFSRKKNQSSLVFTGLSINEKPMHPKQEGSVLAKDISQTNQVNLDHDENIVEIQFSLLRYMNPSKHQYQYRMSGLFDHWVSLGNRNKIIFTNLNPGSYNLEVRAANEDGMWSDPQQMAFLVNPPIWQTWYAYIFYLLLIAGIVYAVRTFNINRERLKNKVKIEHLKLENIQKIAENQSELYDIRMRFFTNLSHEFRTPLTLIMSPLEKFNQEHTIPSPKQLQLMYKNADLLKRLITQVLDFRKMEKDGLKYEPSWGDVARFIKETARVFTPLAQKKSLQYSINCSENHLMAWFDRDKLEKILFNLLSNAFNYTENGFVKLEATFTKKDENTCHLHFQVSDSGIGIPQEQCDHIFERFYHVRSTNDAHNRGTGIGLALTKEMVELHQGQIDVESEVNLGSTFTVTLKLNTNNEKHETHAKLQPAGEIAEETERSSHIHLENGIHAEALENDPEEKEILPEILLIEDNDDLREYLSMEFEKKFQVREARNGKEGLEMAQNKAPDLVVADIMMPEMDGLTLCQELKEDDETSHIPVILLTAHNSKVTQQQGYGIGADDYITKPFDPQLLETRIRNLLKNRTIMHDRFSREVRLEPTNLQISSMDEAFLKKAMQVVESNFTNPNFNADFFASEMCMSRVHLYRKLKALTDMSVSDFVRNARLKLAAMLIKDNKMIIKEAAYTVGFKDPKYFSKCFKQYFGMKPSEYVEEHNRKRENMQETIEEEA